MGTKLLGYLLLGVAVIIVASVLFLNSNRSNETLVFSPIQMLNATWLQYKANILEADTWRTVDKDRGGITTSEGESYTMLRAVWLGDKATFDSSWKWTADNLQHKTNDKLFAWLFGKHPDGTYGVLTSQGGNTTASDADTDIALSLVFAYARWQDQSYLTAAQNIISDIWNNEVIVIQGTPYLAADNLEKTSASGKAVINPSYFHPAAYRIFSRIDPSHPWLTLANSSYTLLNKSMAAPLDKKTSANIPPDWININKTTGEISPPQNATSNFGYDAMRVPWRIALDYEWFKSPESLDTLKQMSFLQKTYESDQKLKSTYAHSGDVIDQNESPAMYGATIGYFLETNKKLADQIYTTKLEYIYDPGVNGWKQKLSYYDDNWTWFGIALYNRLLPNLAASVPSQGFTASSTNSH
jgi:endo-1,4-beta-D-glucanase Y